MPGNNIKLLTLKQLMDINARYDFEYLENTNQVVVKIKNYSRQTLHDASQKFNIHSKVRAFTFTPEAISIWIQLKREGKNCSLVNVQNTINKHYVLYQEVTLKSVKNMLAKNL